MVSEEKIVGMTRAVTIAVMGIEQLTSCLRIQYGELNEMRKSVEAIAKLVSDKKVEAYVR